MLCAIPLAGWRFLRDTMGKTCCFIGQKNVKETDYLFDILERNIKNLIENYDVDKFLFNADKGFSLICHKVVTDLKNRGLSFIQRIAFVTEGQTVSLEEEGLNLTLYSRTDSPFYVAKYEKDVNIKSRIGITKALPAEINEQMINVSDFCFFLYLPSASPKPDTTETASAYRYAVMTKKPTYNILP